MHGSCYKSQNLSSKCLPYPHQQPEEKKKFVQSWFHMYSMIAKEPCVFFLPPPIYSIGEMKTMHILSHFNGWQVIDAFIWHSAAKTVLNGVPKNTWEENCTVQSSCSESHAVMFFSWNGLMLDLWQSVAILLAHSCKIRWGWLFAVNNQNCLNMVSFCSRTVQHFIAIMMCKVWCNVGSGRCWYILHPTVQISPHVITGCLHMWNNIFGVNNLNRKTMLTLLLLPLYIVWARMNTELQVQMRKVCGQCWWFHWVEDMCVNIQEYQ